jgi:hypothetical protein
MPYNFATKLPCRGQIMFLDSSFAEPYKSWAQFASSVGSLFAFIAAGVWFVTTNKFRRRIKLDVDGKILPLPSNNDKKILEIQICFENKGFVDHRIRKLTVSVHAPKSETGLITKETTRELKFEKPLLDETNLVPEHLNFYFVRPGVRQVVSHIVPIDGHVSLIRITVGFDYDRRGYYPHTVRHIFSTATEDA